MAAAPTAAATNVPIGWRQRRAGAWRLLEATGWADNQSCRNLAGWTHAGPISLSLAKPRRYFRWPAAVPDGVIFFHSISHRYRGQ